MRLWGKSWGWFLKILRLNMTFWGLNQNVFASMGQGQNVRIWVWTLGTLSCWFFWELPSMVTHTDLPSYHVNRRNSKKQNNSKSHELLSTGRRSVFWMQKTQGTQLNPIVAVMWPPRDAHARNVTWEACSELLERASRIHGDGGCCQGKQKEPNQNNNQRTRGKTSSFTSVHKVHTIVSIHTSAN